MIAALFLLALLGSIVGIFTMITSNQEKILARNLAKDTTDLGIDAFASRLVAIFSTPGEDCGQDYGICPAIYPDPLNCNAVQFKASTGSSVWEFSSRAGLKDHFVVPNYTGLGSTARQFGTAPRKAGSLGVLKMPNFKIVKSDDSAISASLAKKGFVGSVVGGFTGEIDGYTCSANGLISETFFHISAVDGQGQVEATRDISLPVNIPQPRCIVTPEKRLVVAGEPVEVSVVTVGPWDSVGPPLSSGTFSPVPIANGSPLRSLSDNDLAWTGYLTFPGPAGSCTGGAPIVASVRLGNMMATCRSQVRVEVPGCVPPPPNPTLPVVPPVPPPGAGTVVPPKERVPSPARLPQEKPDPAKPKPPLPAGSRCPDSYFVNSGGVQFKMVYVEVDGECLGFRGKI